MSMTEPKRLIGLADRFEQDFGGVTRAEREKIIEVLHIFMEELREAMTESVKMMKKISLEMDESCHTCAFNPVGDGLKGFAGTTYGLVHAILHDKLFLCYGNQSDWKANTVDPDQAELCSGFTVVRIYSGSKATIIALRAMKAIREIVPKKK